MRRHSKALQFSLALHTLIFAAFAGIGGTLSALTAKNRLLPMEFDLETVEAPAGAPAASAQPAARTRMLKAAAAPAAAQKSERILPAPSPREDSPRTTGPAPASLNRDTPIKEALAYRSGGETAIPESVPGAVSSQPAAVSSPGGAADLPAPRTASLNTTPREGERPGVRAGTSGIAEGIRGRIEALKSYPFAARRRGVEGTVIVSVKVNGTGDLIENRIQRSSGSPILDESALSLIKKVFPYKHSAGVDIELDIPITYRLKS